MIGQASEDVLILAIESSCDETAAAVVKNGRTVLSNVISSQIATHGLWRRGSGDSFPGAYKGGQLCD